MIINRYAAALLSIAIVILTAFVAIPEGQLGAATVGQLIVLAAGAIVTYLVPLVDSRWAGILKTGAAIVTAIVTALIPLFIQGGAISPIQIAVVALAALNALAVEVGVQLRLGSGDVALAPRSRATAFSSAGNAGSLSPEALARRAARGDVNSI